MKTYLIDTNYFLRLLLNDNHKQHKEVYNLFQKAIDKKVELYSTVPVFFEIYWVLSSFYNKDKNRCIDILKKIMQMNYVSFENDTILQYALILFEQKNIDLEDCYNIAVYKREGFDTFATFDKKVQKITAWK